MKMKYVGKGAWIIGVPARDLSADEVRFYGKDKLEKSGLYVESYKRKPKVELPEDDLQIEEA
jgi:hypothetical protein